MSKLSLLMGVMVFLMVELGGAVEIKSANPVVGKKFRLEKTPKSLFLIKKAKVDVNAGEPQFYPIEAQLRMITNEPILQNTNRFK